MKKSISLFEGMLYIIFLGVTSSLILHLFFGVKVSIGCLILTGILLEVMYIYLTVFSWRGLPEGCLRNPLGFIEIHLENKCMGSRKIFLMMCFEAIQFCINDRKRVMLDTCLIKENHIKEIFGDAAKIYKPGIVQRVANLIFKLIYKNKVKAKSFRFILNFDKLTYNQINEISGNLSWFTKFN